jgi:hypothetical protein
MTRYIEVRITRSGAVHAETAGFRGPECLAWVKPLERLLDAEVASSHFTDEFDLTPQRVEEHQADEQELG